MYEQIQATVLDPTLRDPFDRFILATALQLKAPLVTADRAIAATGAAEIVW